MIKFLYGSVPFEVESDFDIHESARRLESATSRDHRDIVDAAAVGSVSTNRVKLHRAVPFVKNSFKPFFIGNFRQRAGKVYLSGRFSMHWFTKAFMTYWFGFLALAGGIILKSIVVSGERFHPAALAVPGFMAFGVLLVWFGRRVSSGDVAWLSELMRTALSDGCPNSSLKRTDQSLRD